MGNNRKRWIKRLAEDRIERLFDFAKERFPDSNLYVERILAISTKYRVPLRKDIRLQICKGCHAFLQPGFNQRVRLNKGRVIMTCLCCGRKKRYPYSNC